MILSRQSSGVCPQAQRTVPVPACTNLVIKTFRSSSQATPLAHTSRPTCASAVKRSPEPPVNESEEARAEGVRLQMARAMNATVLRFNVPEYKTSPGNWLAIVGSLDELGAWSAQRGTRMKWLPGHEWVADVILPEHYSGSFEYKLVLMNDKGLCVWEPGTNRRMQVAGAFSNDKAHIDISLQWGLREVEPFSEAELEFPSAMLEAMYERAEQAVRAMPGINAATVLLQAQQQLSASKRVHKEQVTALRAQLVALQQSSQRETNRVQSRMRDIERTMETVQARLEQERKISERHIELLKAEISEKKAQEAEAAAEAEALAAAEAIAAAEAEAAAAEARAGPEISVYEPHVMALLPNYSGLSVERLHSMLRQAVFEPKYTRDSPEDLASLMTHLTATNKITVDNGIYRYRSRDGSLVGSRRARTPRAASPMPAASTNKSIGLNSQMLALEPKVLACLDGAGSSAGVPLERLVGMLRSVAPRASVTLEQLELLMDHLEYQGKVAKDKKLYKHAKAVTRTRRASTEEQRSRSPSPHRATPAPQRAAAAVAAPAPPKRKPAPVPAPAPEPEPEPTPAYVPEPIPAGFSGRIYTDGEFEYIAPEGSVAGGPPGSEYAGKLAPGLGGSIMPSFDSTGAHPTIESVSQFERPVLEVLSSHGGLSLERLHMLVCSTFPEFSQSSITELAAVVKNLTDQHKVHASDGTIEFLGF